MSEWQPITSGPDEGKAPWDGTPVLIYTDHNWGWRRRVATMYP